MKKDLLSAKTKTVAQKKVLRPEIDSLVIPIISYGALTVAVSLMTGLIISALNGPVLLATLITSGIMLALSSGMVSLGARVDLLDASPISNRLNKRNGFQVSSYGRFGLSDKGFFLPATLPVFEAESPAEERENDLLFEQVRYEKLNVGPFRVELEQEVHDTPLGLWNKTMEAVEHANK